MAGVNKVIIVGNVGRDPELRTTQGGQNVSTFSVATNERFKDKSGEWQDRTEWHRVVAWGRLAEICGEYLKKGRQVYIEGRLQTRDWEDKDGHKRYTTEVIAQSMQMLGSPRGGGDEPSSRSGGDFEYSAPGGSGGGGDDEIPF
ncbi:MAG: single-stranded DNA-binding protein [Deltaproteobacteria bacterium]|nr:single-stranded DNA-binding protein [Deltaproteobacteria bacterium]